MLLGREDALPPKLLSSLGTAAGATTSTSIGDELGCTWYPRVYDGTFRDGVACPILIHESHAGRPVGILISRRGTQGAWVRGAISMTSLPGVRGLWRLERHRRVCAQGPMPTILGREWCADRHLTLWRSSPASSVAGPLRCVRHGGQSGWLKIFCPRMPP